MDAITQIQSYLRTLAAALCSSIENLQQESEPVVDPEASLSVEQRNKVEERAEHLFRLFYEVDLMIASLPKKFSTEQEQLQIIHKLNEQSLELGARMDRAKVEAEHWEGKVSKALARIADQQLNTHAQSFDES